MNDKLTTEKRPDEIDLLSLSQGTQYHDVLQCIAFVHTALVVKIIP